MAGDCFLIVDGNSLMHRAFHAMPPMDYQGTPTGALHGFLMMLFKVFEERKPAYCAVAFDEHAPTFRHLAYPEYKAGRQKTPDELVTQLRLIRELLPALHIPVYAVAGYEADDILGTVGRLNTEKEIDTMLLTGDRDALQLVGNRVSLLFTKKGITETILFDPAGVREYFGVTPDQVTDLKGLMGDSSDNITGVPGVGEKTAVKWLQEYGSLDNVLAHADEIKGKIGEKLRDNRDLALFSRKLATIVPEAPIVIDYDACRTDRVAEGLPALRQLGLSVAAQRAQKLSGEPAAAIPEEAPEEPAALAEKLADEAGIRAFADGLKEAEQAALYVGTDRFSLAGDGRCAEAQLGQATLLDEGLTAETALSAADALLHRPVFTHDAKKLYHVLDRYDLPRPPVPWDTQLGAYLLNPLGKSFPLRDLGPENAGTVLRQAGAQEKQLKELGMDALYRDIELPLFRVLYDMEKTGFQVDAEVLRGLGREYTKKTEELRDEIYRSCGVSGFNLNSPQQLGKVLFETLGLTAGKKNQRGYSTDAETLEKLIDDHPAVRMILDYRTFTKFNATYIDGLLRNIDGTGRVHSYFDQTGTATGRISSSEPNLQNIPVRTDLGREIRRAFVAKDGCLLVDADYSQIELRVLAHMSGDAAMTDAFRRGQDIHTRTAAEVYGVPMEDVTHEMRSASKAVNFGIVYGISDFGLARNIGVSRWTAHDFIERYLSRYPGIREFMEGCKRKGHELGYAETMFGRRRPLPELRVGRTRAFGERVAMNMPVQGSAADIIKLAMVRVSERLKDEMPEARLILQVHDELLIEAPEALAGRAAGLLKEVMESVAELSVPLVAEVKTGKSWYETK